MRKINVLLFSLLLTVNGIAQSNTDINVDSEKKLLQTAPQDTSRSKLLYKLVSWYGSVDRDSMFKYLQQQLVLSEKLNYKRGVVEVYEAMAGYYYGQDNIPKGMEYTYKCVRLAEQSSDPYISAYAYGSLGTMHSHQGNTKEALYAYKKSYSYLDPANLEDRGYVALNIAKLFYALKSQDSAIFYAEHARQLYTKAKSKSLAVALIGLSNFHYDLGNKQLADTYVQMSLENAVEKKHLSAQASAYATIAYRFFNEQKRDSALTYIRKSLLLYQRFNSREAMTACYKMMAEIFALKEMFDSAYYYQTKRQDLNNEIKAENNLAAIQNLSFEERLRQREREADAEKAKQERLHNLQYAAIAFAIITFLILFFALSHSIIANQKLIRFLGVIALLIVFEFLNLLLHPWLGKITHHSPILMLLAMVGVAALLIPLHHKLEHWITHKMVEKNNRIRLAAAKRTIQQLEGSVVQPKN